MKTLKILLGLLVISFLAFPAAAQPARFIAGTHYQVVDTPVRTEDSSRIEVIELFWYGCPGCYQFEPLLVGWESSQAPDIDHKRLPAVWDPLTKLHAQAFFAAQSLEAMEAIHDPFFDEFHQKRNRLLNEVVIRDFFESCGISNEDFDRVFNSFSVRTKVNQAEAQMKKYGPAQTPSLYVNGKYVVTLGEGGFERMLEVVDYLIEIERKA